jgi:two-component system, NarL family, invasion response regulator UvrY
MPRVLLVDDHLAIQVGLRELLTTEFPAIQIALANSEESALEALAKGHWDIAVLDISLPRKGGLELIQILKQRRPQLKVLVYTMHSESQFGLRAFRSGADGFLTKDSTPESLFLAIRQLLGGRKYLSSELAEQLASAAAGDFEGERYQMLSEREYQVFQALAAGRSLTEIGLDLKINIKTASTYRSRILEKLELKTRADLIRYALRHGLLQQ